MGQTSSLPRELQQLRQVSRELGIDVKLSSKEVSAIRALRDRIKKLQTKLRKIEDILPQLQHELFRLPAQTSTKDGMKHTIDHLKKGSNKEFTLTLLSLVVNLPASTVTDMLLAVFWTPTTPIHTCLQAARKSLKYVYTKIPKLVKKKTNPEPEVLQGGNKNKRRRDDTRAGDAQPRGKTQRTNASRSAASERSFASTMLREAQHGRAPPSRSAKKKKTPEVYVPARIVKCSDLLMAMVDEDEDLGEQILLSDVPPFLHFPHVYPAITAFTISAEDGETPTTLPNFPWGNNDAFQSLSLLSVRKEFLHPMFAKSNVLSFQQQVLLCLQSIHWQKYFPADRVARSKIPGLTNMRSKGGICWKIASATNDALPSVINTLLTIPDAWTPTIEDIHQRVGIRLTCEDFAAEFTFDESKADESKTDTSTSRAEKWLNFCPTVTNMVPSHKRFLATINSVPTNMFLYATKFRLGLESSDDPNWLLHMFTTAVEHGNGIGFTRTGVDMFVKLLKRHLASDDDADADGDVDMEGENMQDVMIAHLIDWQACGANEVYVAQKLWSTPLMQEAFVRTMWNDLESWHHVYHLQRFNHHSSPKRENSVCGLQWVPDSLWTSLENHIHEKLENGIDGPRMLEHNRDIVRVTLAGSFESSKSYSVNQLGMWMWLRMRVVREIAQDDHTIMKTLGALFRLASQNPSSGAILRDIRKTYQADGIVIPWSDGDRAWRDFGHFGSRVGQESTNIDALLNWIDEDTGMPQMVQFHLFMNDKTELLHLLLKWRNRDGRCLDPRLGNDSRLQLQAFNHSHLKLLDAWRGPNGERFPVKQFQAMLCVKALQCLGARSWECAREFTNASHPIAPTGGKVNLFDATGFLLQTTEAPLTTAFIANLILFKLESNSILSDQLLPNITATPAQKRALMIRAKQKQLERASSRLAAWSS